MSATEHYDPADLALFAMQLLPRNEQTTMTAHIADCTYCRQELAHLQGDLAVYAHTVDLHSPPAFTRERLLNQIAREKKVAPVERIETTEAVVPARARVPQAARAIPRRHQTRGKGYTTGLGSGPYLPEQEEKLKPGVFNTVFTKVFSWVGWAVAAGLAIMAGNLYHEHEAQRARLFAQMATIDKLTSDAAAARQILDTITDTSARQVMLTPASTPSAPPAPQARTTYVADKGSLIFLASNLEPLQPYKTYELWLIPADGRDPIPAGTFHPDARGNASVILPPLPKGIEAKAFGVTIEDDGGSQTPTMPIVMAGS